MPVPSTSAFPAPQQSLRERATSVLRDAILDGTLAPGERLNDQELQSWLGVSRVSLRAAIHTLVDEGLIETRAQSHTRVAVPDPARLGDYAETIGVLLGGVAQVTVPALDSTQAASLIERAVAVGEEMRAGDLEAASAAHLLFLQTFLEACPNTVLAGAARSVLQAAHYHASRSSILSDYDLDTPLRIIGHLGEAVAARDGAQARAALEGFYRTTDHRRQP